MKILEVKPNVELLAFTPNPDNVVASAARLCYSPNSIKSINDEMQGKTAENLIKKILDFGHFSVLEHVSFTFGIEGISRTLSHQLVRHRIASYSQQSQRYVKLDEGLNVIIPDSVKKNQMIKLAVDTHFEASKAIYKSMIQNGIPAEDARFVLPNATETKLVMTMNARELYHFLNKRLCVRAQWEIREVAKLIKQELDEVAPMIFSKCGKPCDFGNCPEGNLGCR